MISLSNILTLNRNNRKPQPAPVAVETPRKFRCNVLGKMERGLLEAGAVQYSDSFVIFFEDVTAVILDAQNFHFDIWAHPTYTASVVVLDADTGAWVEYESGAELLAVLATL